jgi:hypothetical protein
MLWTSRLTAPVQVMVLMLTHLPTSSLLKVSCLLPSNLSRHSLLRQQAVDDSDSKKVAAESSKRQLRPGNDPHPARTAKLARPSRAEYAQKAAQEEAQRTAEKTAAKEEIARLRAQLAVVEATIRREVAEDVEDIAGGAADLEDESMADEDEDEQGSSREESEEGKLPQPQPSLSTKKPAKVSTST